MSSTKAPHRIIMIEDNPADIMLLRYAFDQHEEAYELEVFTDGESALHFVQQYCPDLDQGGPCLVVLDLHLPRFDGETILRAIRSQPELSRVKVVALTTMASPTERARVLDLGVELYAIKPLNLDQTVDLAAELIAICKDSYRQIAAQA